MAGTCQHGRAFRDDWRAYTLSNSTGSASNEPTCVRPREPPSGAHACHTTAQRARGISARSNLRPEVPPHARAAVTWPAARGTPYCRGSKSVAIRKCMKSTHARARRASRRVHTSEQLRCAPALTVVNRVQVTQTRQRRLQHGCQARTYPRSARHPEPHMTQTYKHTDKRARNNDDPNIQTHRQTSEKHR